jgi:mono/diheme cytochrome c family protein
MLKRFDKGLALFSWLAAAAGAVMLVAGPSVVAHDSNKAAAVAAGASPYAASASTSAPDGKALFKSNCGSCHTLAAAGTNGQVGPDLGKVKHPATAIEAIMKAGPGVMPSFSGMAAAQRKAIAAFVAKSE